MKICVAQTETHGCVCFSQTRRGNLTISSTTSETPVGLGYGAVWAAGEQTPSSPRTTERHPLSPSIDSWPLCVERGLLRLGVSLACRIENGLKEGQNLAQDQCSDDQAQANECQSPGLGYGMEEDNGGVHTKG